MKKMPLIISSIVVLILLVAYLGYGMISTRSHSFYGSMMGNGNSMMGNGGGTMMGGYNQNIQTITSENAKTQMDASLNKATINKGNNSITYTGDEVHIDLLGGPEQADGKFVIGDLVNPTLYVPKDARVDLELINADEGMPHGIEITNAAPPYGQMSMMQGGIIKGAIISPLPAAQNGTYTASQISFQSDQSGQYYYICQYPGHAAKGMYGKIIFK